MRRGGAGRLSETLLPEGGHAGSGVSCEGVPERLHTPFAVHCSLTVPAGAMAKGQKTFLVLYCLHALTARGSEIQEWW